MPSGFNLSRECHKFASDLTALLNRTVCDGVRLNQVEILKPAGFQVGYLIKKTELTSKGIPLTLGRAPKLFLGVSYHLAPDAEGHYLMVTTSMLGLFADAELDHALLHYDYERDKGDGYPEAHLQVCAESGLWAASMEACGRPGLALEKLHLPVGGRRYRPSLEDLIQLVASEGLCQARAGWVEVLDESRADFMRKQLRAAVRRNPDDAIEALRGGGWAVTRNEE